MNSNKQYQEYYSKNDYNDTLKKLPEIIKIAEQKSLELMEPTIYEQREIMTIIKQYVSDKKRKVYGGTALNALIANKNPQDAIYDDYHFGDIDFYSYEPIVDLVEICNNLYNTKKFKQVNGKEAFHEESYRVNVNMQMYCNITYVPKKIYNGIKTIPIDGLDYVDPHFIWIDQLRISTNPLVDSRLWEQTFKRSFLLLKNYLPEVFNSNFDLKPPSSEITDLMTKIKQDFLTQNNIQESTIINGFDAYNFYVRFSMDKEKMTGGKFKQYGSNNEQIIVPYLELTTIKYNEVVTSMYSYLKTIVKQPELIGYSEYYPFFQFIGYSIVFTYDSKIIVVINESSSVCIPIIKGTSGVRYASYQYLLMSLLVNKFKFFLDKDKDMYLIYGTTISNLIAIKNDYLSKHKLHPINDSAFSEFRIPCIGTPVNSARLYVARKIEKKEKGKREEFRYFPENFFKSTSESQSKFDPKKACFKNSSGNIIIGSKNTQFKLGPDDRLIKNELIDNTEILDNCIEYEETD